MGKRCRNNCYKITLTLFGKSYRLKYGTPQLPIFYFFISELFLLILSYCFSFYIINILNIYHHFFFYIPSIFFYIIDFLLDHHFSIKPLLFIIFQQIFSTIFLTIAFLSYHRKNYFLLYGIAI